MTTQINAMNPHKEFYELSGLSQNQRSEINAIEGLDAHQIFLNGKFYVASSNPYNPRNFWKMILDKESPIIVRLNQHGMNYIPQKSESFKLSKRKSFKVEVISIEKIESTLTVRKIHITSGKKVHKLTHIHFLKWKDFSVPEVKDMQLLLEEVGKIKFIGTPFTPITVHCAGGIGRTGTFILLHSTSDKESPDFPQSLLQMRAQRDGRMVETAEQYAFVKKVHSLVIEFEKERKKSEKLENEDDSPIICSVCTTV